MRFGQFTVTVAMVVASEFSSFSVLAHGPEIGKAAPPLTLSGVLQAPANTIATWEALRGKVVVIDFWATWCPPCRESIPHWNELVDTFKDKPVIFIAITDQHDQIVSAFLKRMPIYSWVGLDGVGLPNSELLPEVLDRRVLAVVEKPDAVKEEKLSNDQRRQVAAIRGQIPKAEWKGLPAEDRENIELLRAELAKPDDERYAPDLAAILAAVREQLGLDLSLQRRSMPILIVEKAEPKE